MANETFTDEAPTRRDVGRMSLANVETGRKRVPVRAMFTGEGGVGKTSLVCGAPNAIILDVEGGAHQQDVARFPEVYSWDDVVEAVRVLQTQEHDYKTLIVDTIDAAELLCQTSVCQHSGWASMETPGYGRAYKAVHEEWERFLAELDKLMSERGVNVLLVAHTQVGVYSNPDGSDYSRHALKMHKKIAASVFEWCDVVGYISREPIISTSDGKKKAVGTRHLIRFAPGATYEAKSRYAMPDEIEMPADPAQNWAVFQAAFAAALKGGN